MARKVDENKVKATKNEIIYASIALIMKKSFSQFTLSAVAKEIGMTKAALYWYFPTKDDLVKAIVAATREAQLKIIQDLKASDYNAKKIWFEMFTHASENTMTCLLSLKLLLEFYSEDNDITLEIREGYNAYKGFLTTLIQQGINNGEFRTDISAEEMAVFILSALDGYALHQAVLGNDYDAFSPKSFARIIESFLVKKGNL